MCRGNRVLWGNAQRPAPQKIETSYTTELIDYTFIGKLKILTLHWMYFDNCNIVSYINIVNFAYIILKKTYAYLGLNGVNKGK